IAIHLEGIGSGYELASDFRRAFPLPAEPKFDAHFLMDYEEEWFLTPSGRELLDVLPSIDVVVRHTKLGIAGGWIPTRMRRASYVYSQNGSVRSNWNFDEYAAMVAVTYLSKLSHQGEPLSKTSKAVRPRFVRRAEPSLLLKERSLREQGRQHLVRPCRLLRDPSPRQERLPVLRLEIEQEVSHLPPELVRLLALQDHREVGVTGPLDDERVVAVGDRAEGLPAEDREGSAHEILDHIEGGPEQILIDGRLPLPRLGADQRPVLEGEERGLDRIPAGLESADSLRDALATPGKQGVNRGCLDDGEARRERRRDLGAQRTEDAVRPQSEE